MNFKKIVVLNITFLVASCSSSLYDHYCHPNKNDLKLQSGKKSILVVSTNNLRSREFQQQEPFSVDKDNNPIFIEVGGLSTLKSYINILNKKFNNRVVLLDSGPLFEKSSNSKTINRILKKYHQIGYDAIAFGKKELAHLNKIRAAAKNGPFLINSNILNLKRKKLQIPKVLPYRIIKKNRLKIGVVSLSTPDKKNSLTNFYFEDVVLSLLKVKKKIGRKIDVFIVMIDTNTKCVSANSTNNFTFKDHKNNQLICPTSDGLTEFAKRLPPEGVDLIITNSENFTNGFIGTIPIMGNLGLGKYFSLASITVNQKREISKDESIIYSPTKLCTHFFKGRDSCFIDSKDIQLSIIHSSSNKNTADIPTSRDNNLVPARFLGVELK